MTNKIFKESNLDHPPKKTSPLTTDAQPSMILATTHLNADLDGLASLVALSLLEGPATLVLPGNMDQASRHLWKDQAQHFPGFSSKSEVIEQLKQKKIFRLVVVDTSRAKRIGFIAQYLDCFTEIETWDTHPSTSDDLHRINLPPCGATISALIPQLLLAECSVTKEVAGLFLLGIHCDTGDLRYPGTTSVDHQAAAQCIKWGADLSWLERYLPRGLNRHSLQLMNQMLSEVEAFEFGGVDVILLRLELEQHQADLSSLLSNLRESEGWSVVFLIISDPNRVSVIGRSDGSMNISHVLRPLGGGGHAEAGSASVRGHTLLQVRELLLRALQNSHLSPPNAAKLATEHIFSITIHDDVETASNAMHRYRINALPILDGDEIVGILSRREIDEALRHGLAKEPSIAISAGPPPWIHPEAEVNAIRKLLLSSFCRLVVVGVPPSNPAGVITRSTVFRSQALDPPLTEGSQSPSSARLWQKTKRFLGDLGAHIERLGVLAKEMNLRALLVGGCVRDVLLRRSSLDIDIVVIGDAPKLALAAAEQFGGEVHIHETFGTAHWIPIDSKLGIDMATARTESYAVVAALPEVSPGALRQDLYRRDFTVNMLAMGICSGEMGALIDPYGGQADLSGRTLRVVHGLSFYDDPTRAWRAARFAARFEFTLAPGTRGLLKEALRFGVLDRISDERLGQEMQRLFQEREVVQAMGFLRSWGLLRRLHPALQTDRDLMTRIAKTREAWITLSAIAPEKFKDPAEALWIALGWSLSNKDRQARLRLVSRGRGRMKRWQEAPEKIRRALRALPKQILRSEQAQVLSSLDSPSLIFMLGASPDTEAILWWVRTGETIKAAVSGRDLIEMGGAPGPSFRIALDAVLDCARDGGDRNAQMKTAQKHLNNTTDTPEEKGTND